MTTTPPKQRTVKQPKPPPPAPPPKPFTGRVDRRGRPFFDSAGNPLPRPSAGQHVREWFEDYVTKPRRKKAADRARARNAQRANTSGANNRNQQSRWDAALHQHRKNLGLPTTGTKRRRRRRPTRRRAGAGLTLLAGTLAVTAAALHLISVAMAAELGMAAEGLGLAACWIVCEPAPPKAPSTRGKQASGPGGYVRGGTCGSTATKDKKPCGNPVAQGQGACHLHGGSNPNGTGKSTPASKAGSNSAPTNGQTPPAKRKRTKAKSAPPAPPAKTP